MQNTLAIPDRVNATVIEDATGVGPFGFDFEWLTGNEVVVEIYGEEISDFTVVSDLMAQGQFHVGGRVTLSEAVDGVHLVIRRSTPPGRKNDISTGGATPQALNAELDRLAMVNVDLAELLRRAVILKFGQELPLLDAELWNEALPYVSNGKWANLPASDVRGAAQLLSEIPLLQEILSNMSLFEQVAGFSPTTFSVLIAQLQEMQNREYFVPDLWSDMVGETITDPRATLNFWGMTLRPEVLPFVVPPLPDTEFTGLIKIDHAGCGAGVFTQPGDGDSTTELAESLANSLSALRSRLEAVEGGTGFKSAQIYSEGPLWTQAGPVRVVQIGQTVGPFYTLAEVQDDNTRDSVLKVIGEGFPTGFTVNGGEWSAEAAGTWPVKRIAIDLDGNRTEQEFLLMVQDENGVVPPITDPPVASVEKQPWAATRDTLGL